MGHITRFKKLNCDRCPNTEDTEVSELDDGSRAILVQNGWRLIMNSTKQIRFRCPTCWQGLETGEFPVGKSAGFDGNASMVVPPSYSEPKTPETIASRGPAGSTSQSSQMHSE